MTHREILDDLERLIQSRSILTHPFYVAWQRGALTRDQLATYAKVYYPHVAAFPRYLRTAIASADDPVVRSELARNLDDETGNPAPHNELWLAFAEGVGVEREEVVTANPQPAAERIVATYDRLTGGESAQALAALYAYESQQPEVARRKAEGLERCYGVRDPEALAYFDVHAEMDLHHRDGERQAMERCLAQGASPAALLGAAKEALEAYWGLLDGVCQEAGIPAAA